MEPQAARILLADDEELFRLTTADILRRAGYRCDSVVDGTAALAALQQQAYDLLIADIRMPGNNALELLHACVQAGHALPIIIVTACPSFDTAVGALRAAVVDYHTKPLNLPEFLDSVARAVAKGRLWQTMRQTRQDMHAWAQNLEHMEHAMLRPGAHDPASAPGVTWSLEQYVEQTTTHLATMVATLHQTLATIRQDTPPGPVDVCQTLQCPRRSRYEASIDDAIAVITRTRQAFRSRDLGELRRRLEQVRRESGS